MRRASNFDDFYCFLCVLKFLGVDLGVGELRHTGKRCKGGRNAFSGNFQGRNQTSLPVSVDVLSFNCNLLSHHISVVVQPWRDWMNMLRFQLKTGNVQGVAAQGRQSDERIMYEPSYSICCHVYRHPFLLAFQRIVQMTWGRWMLSSYVSMLLCRTRLISRQIDWEILGFDLLVVFRGRIQVLINTSLILDMWIENMEHNNMEQHILHSMLRFLSLEGESRGR